jgi:phosphoserine/homoserine phosphotransferase
MQILCSDLEGVFVPEVWINVAEKTGIDELRLTTRDISDYDELMTKRLGILKENGLKLKDIQDVIATIEPIHGAKEFLEWLKRKTQFVIVSDTFVEFADPLMEKLGRPTLLCNSLTIGDDGSVVNYVIRQKDQKNKVVKAFKGLNYDVIAMGDSYNDISMILEADTGLLFKPPQNVIDDYPQLPVINNYEDLKVKLEELL